MRESVGSVMPWVAGIGAINTLGLGLAGGVVGAPIAICQAGEEAARRPASGYEILIAVATVDKQTRSQRT